VRRYRTKEWLRRADVPSQVRPGVTLHRSEQVDTLRCSIKNSLRLPVEPDVYSRIDEILRTGAVAGICLRLSCDFFPNCVKNNRVFPEKPHVADAVLKERSAVAHRQA